MDSWAGKPAVFVVIGVGAVLFALYNVVGLVRQGGEESKYTPQHAIDLAEPDDAPESGPLPESSKTDSLRVAIAPVISPEKSLDIYREFVHYLAGRLGRAPVFLQRDTYAEVNDLVRYGRCDIALVCTYAFVRGEREFGMEVLVVPEIHGAVTYHSLILVPRSVSADSLLDLRGKRFASADLLSNSGWLFPVVWLRNHGENADTFFKEHVITGSHDRSVTAVASRYVDGAAVDSLVYDQMVEADPSIPERTKIILKSPPFGMPPVVVPRHLDPALKQRLRTALLEMHTHEEGKRVLAALRIGRFIIADSHLFDSVREASKILETRG